MKATAKELKLMRGKQAPKNPELTNDTRTSHLTDDMVHENQQILNLCREYHESLGGFRAERRRSRKYLEGDQWHEEYIEADGTITTEEEHMKDQGVIPIKQNYIITLMNNIVGQYRSNPSKSSVVSRKREDSKVSEMLSNALHTVKDNNHTEELDAANLRERILSGAAIGKVTYKYFPTLDREDVFIQNVNPNRAFFNSDIEDPRLTDLRLVGEIVDATLDDIVATFAETEADANKIKSWYTTVDPKNMQLVYNNGLSSERLDQIDFYMPSDTGKGRVIIVWEKVMDWRTREHDYLRGTLKVTKRSVKEVESENDERIELGTANGLPPEEIKLIDAKRRKEQFWVVKYLTPYGQCLWQGETMYEHQEHPYVMILHPLLDGTVYGLIKMIIDQQRAINRLFILNDMIMTASAKGLLMIPEAAIPEGMTEDDFAESWTKINGVITYVPKPGGAKPEQLSTNVTNVGTHEMLAMQMKFMQEISGVSDAMSGRTAKSGTPSSLYAQEAMNSAVNIKDLMDNFGFFKKLRDEKVLKVILQYYKEERMLKISGERYTAQASYYDPGLIGNDFHADLIVAPGLDTPAYRQIIEDSLAQLLDRQVIDGKMYLENSSMPYADNLLESISQREQQMQQGGQGGLNIPQDVEQGVMDGANPEAAAMIQQMFAGGQE